MKELTDILKFADYIAYAKTNKYLNTLSRKFFHKLGKKAQNTYDEIAEKGYTISYIQECVTSYFKKSLSQDIKKK